MLVFAFMLELQVACMLKIQVRACIELQVLLPCLVVCLLAWCIVVVMEYFTIQMDELTATNVIRNIYGEHDDINHMIYADDLVIFMKESADGVKALKQVLFNMDLYAGLKLNHSKSKIFFSRDCKHKHIYSSILGISEGNFPTKYLGLSLSTEYIKDKYYNGLLDKVNNRIKG